MQIKDRITKVSIRTHFFLYHLQAAALFARLSEKIERKYKSNAPEAIHVEHRSYVTASILSSVAFLEAAINEIFADTLDSPTTFNGRLEPNSIKLMASMWQIEYFKRYAKILEKYQVALQLTSKAVFDRGSSPYQDISLLIKLRNALIHYVPEWIELRADPIDAMPEHRFEKMLKGKFSLNPLAADSSAFYPHKCLSHGCAEWAVVSCEKFVTDFFTRMKIASVYGDLKSKLTIQ